MTKPRTYQTEAIVLKKTKLGEADRILTFYTPRLGKIQAVAKGVRRPRSKMSGHLELLTHSLVSLARGRNLDTVTGAQTIDGFFKLKGDLGLTSCGLYVTELVHQFTADHVEDPRLFGLLLDTLHHICGTGDVEIVLRYFELYLLEGVGYRPQLQHCVACHSPLKPVANSFSASAGGMLCSTCRRSHPHVGSLSVNALKVLRFLQGNEYGAVSKLEIDAGLSEELEGVMRYYLRYLLERDVKSAAWLDDLRRQMGGCRGRTPRLSSEISRRGSPIP
ncbi:DNA repair protein RecO [Chloroflexota bacterium]